AHTLNNQPPCACATVRDNRQNSVSTGSRSTTQVTLSLWPTSVRRAPSESNRSSSSSVLLPSARRSKCSRFLTGLASGTASTSIDGHDPSGGPILTPSLSSSTTRQPKTAHQKSATVLVSTASIAIAAMRLVIAIILDRASGFG